MVCTHCGRETRVVNSRPQRRLNRVWRRRSCPICRLTFTTIETMDYGGAWLVRDSRDSSFKPFSRDKLFLSVYRSLGHRRTALEDATGLTDSIIGRLPAHLVESVTLPASSLKEVVQVALARFDPAAGTHYAAHHRS